MEAQPKIEDIQARHLHNLASIRAASSYEPSERINFDNPLSPKPSPEMHFVASEDTLSDGTNISVDELYDVRNAARSTYDGLPTKKIILSKDAPALVGHGSFFNQLNNEDRDSIRRWMGVLYREEAPDNWSLWLRLRSEQHRAAYKFASLGSYVLEVAEGSALRAFKRVEGITSYYHSDQDAFQHEAVFSRKRTFRRPLVSADIGYLQMTMSTLGESIAASRE